MAVFICYITLEVDFQNAYSASVSRRVTRGGGGSSPLLFFKIFKKCLDFLGKKCRIYIHLRVKFLIYKAVVSVTSVTYLTFFPVGPFFRLL